jgi:hypothetical protein
MSRHRLAPARSLALASIVAAVPWSAGRYSAYSVCLTIVCSQNRDFFHAADDTSRLLFNNVEGKIGLRIWAWHRCFWLINQANFLDVGK